MKTTFHNVTITVEAESASAAYERLSELLDRAGFVTSYETATYATDADQFETEYDTSDLM